MSAFIFYYNSECETLRAMGIHQANPITSFAKFYPRCDVRSRRIDTRSNGQLEKRCNYIVFLQDCSFLLVEDIFVVHDNVFLSGRPYRCKPCAYAVFDVTAVMNEELRIVKAAESFREKCVIRFSDDSATSFSAVLLNYDSIIQSRL